MFDKSELIYRVDTERIASGLKTVIQKSFTGFNADSNWFRLEDSQTMKM